MRRMILGCGVMLAAVTGCGSGGAEELLFPVAAAVDSVRVYPSDQTEIHFGASQAFTVKVYAVGGASRAVAWTSRQSSFLPISPTGVAHSLYAGSAAYTTYICATSSFDES